MKERSEDSIIILLTHRLFLIHSQGKCPHTLPLRANFTKQMKLTSK